MKFTQRMLMGLGGAVLAVALLIIGWPGMARAAVATLVQVVNTTANPVITSGMDDPGRIPYQVSLSFSCAGNSCQGVFPQVPPTHRLVIQHLSALVKVNAVAPVIVQLGCAGGCAQLQAYYSNNYAPVQNLGVNTGVYAALDMAVLGFYNQGIAPSVAFFTSTTTLARDPEATLSGYMLDCTAAPCATLAQ